MNPRHSLFSVGALAGAVLFLAAGSAAAQSTAPVIVQPGAPGEPSRTLAVGELPQPVEPRYTEADIAFMKGMIPHHAQALEMTRLVPTRSTREDVHLLAERIEVAQGDEIAWMTGWLDARAEAMPAEAMPAADTAHHGGHHGHHAMPGMLSPEEMAQLAAASGAEFDRLFLTFMIKHHEGALVMVRDLLAATGAAQAPEVFRFASDVDADQRADIQRMQAMLRVTGAPAASTPASSGHHHH